nr:MAG TPA: DNA-directed RNA polymerase subunit [Caudoviricetes sp.]
MTEYIEREAMLREVERRERLMVGNKTISVGALKQFIENRPAADVSPVVHGRWLHEETEGGFHSWRCSQCGRGMNDNPEGIDLYCYHCGAKMDGGN